MTPSDLAGIVAGIDQQMGSGYAAAHPELLAACIIADAIERLADDISSAILYASD